jgi:hypothetical protein
MTGGGWGFRMPISTFYQQVIGRSGTEQGRHILPREDV